MPTYFDYAPTYKGTIQKGRSQIKLGANQKLAYKAGAGYYAVPAQKPKGTVVRPQANPLTLIETPAQIEERVKRMADETFKTQQGVLEGEAERMRLEAEGRKRGLAAAYEAAAKANAAMGADVQAGWQSAAGAIQGMAQVGTGGIRDALAADTASAEQALSRVGAAGSGFDARSQAAVEAYRGGTLPAEYFQRMGGVGRQWLNEAAAALNTRGVQESEATYGGEASKISSGLRQQVLELTSGRSKYEQDLREQLLGARGDQIEAISKQQETDRKLAFDYWKQKTYLDQKQAELKLKWETARASATTTAEKLALDKWYKENKLSIDQARTNAYVLAQGSLAATRTANAATAGIKAKTAATKAATDAAKPGAPVPKAWPDAWAQYTARLDDALDGKDPRFFVATKAATKNAPTVYTLKPQYSGPGGAKKLQADLIRLIGKPYATKFGTYGDLYDPVAKRRNSSIAARAYAKAFAIWKIYGGGAATPSPTGTPGVPSTTGPAGAGTSIVPTLGP
jgi:hypothetical protein